VRRTRQGLVYQVLLDHSNIPDGAFHLGEGPIPKDGDRVAGPVMERVRGSDRVKNAQWEGVEKVYQFNDGWYMGRVFTPKDCDTLGLLMGHCAGGHYGWVLQNLTYFFSVFGPDDVPHTTMHAKRTSQMFRNEQPDEDKLRREWYQAKQINSYHQHVTSSMYDSGALRDEGREHLTAAHWDREAKYADDMVVEQQTRYEHYKALALAYGPINHSNPYKEDMDWINRQKVTWLSNAKLYREQADALRDKPTPKAIRGRRVLFQKRDITIISNSVKGADYNHTDKYDGRTREWLDSLPQRDNCPINDPNTGRFKKMTLQELKEVRGYARW
jgi:hypothetical protein